MDEQLVYQLAEEYACEWLTQEKVKRYLYLKEKIVLSLKKEIVAFKNAEANYHEALKYGFYHPDLKRYQAELASKKKNLYAHPLMVEYKKLEGELEAQLKNDINALKQEISNKFPLDRFF